MRNLFQVVALLALSQFAQAASFSCESVRSRLEKMICENQNLSGLDYKLAKIYSLAYTLSDSKDALKNSQRMWLDKIRSRCKDENCLDTSYKKRISELLSLIQERSDSLPTAISGHDVRTGKVQSAYCKLNDTKGNFDTFDISASVSGNTFKGTIDGVYDCGRKVWDSDVKGTVEGNIAFVEFEAGFSRSQTAKAIVCVSRGTLYWRSLEEIRVESYVPESRSVRLKQ